MTIRHENLKIKKTIVGMNKKVRITDRTSKQLNVIKRKLIKSRQMDS